MKVVSTLLALALAGLGFGLDFYSRAARLPVLMPQVEAATGRTLRVDDELRNEVLYINVKDVEEQALLDLIAEAADAKWRTTSSSMVLEPDVAKRRRQAEAELNALRDAFLADLELVANSESEDPVEAEIINLLRKVSLQEVKRSYPNRVVFSSTPIEPQFPLPTSADKLLRLLMEDHVRQSEAQGEVHGDPKLVYEVFSQFLHSRGRRELLDRPEPPESEPSRMLFIIRPGGGRDIESDLVEVVVQNRSGVVLARQVLKIGIEAHMIRRAKERLAGTIPIQPSRMDMTIGTPIQFGSDSKQLLDIQYSIDKRIRTTFPEVVRNWLERPDKYDFLGFMVSDAWDSWCKHFEVNAIVNADDQFPLLPNSRQVRFMSIEAFDKVVRSRNSISLLAGIHVVKPLLPHDSRELRMDRVLMSTYIGEAKQNGGLAKISSFAALVDSQPFSYWPSYVSDFYETQVGPQTQFARLNEETCGLILWNRLTDAQRRSLQRGGQLPLSHLRPSAREFILNIQSLWPELVVPIERPTTKLERWVINAVREEYDPTWWMFPNWKFHYEETDYSLLRASGHGEVRSTSNKDILIVEVDSLGVPVNGAENITLSDLVLNLNVAALKPSSDSMDKVASFYKIGEVERVELQVVVAPEWMVPCYVDIVSLDSRSQVLTLEQVKTQLREDIERIQGEMESSGLINFFRRKKAEGAFDSGTEPPVLN